ncbi:MAG: CDP-archaeol synthase [Marinobacter sp.]|uniref:CDP-archaeol synthase n=1 Tax=Marinobacter sp. TaxID=50741 RepID=UPI0034A07E2E
MLALLLLVLLIVANGAPVIARKFLHQRWNYPIDGGHNWFDRRRVFGANKTWRGLLSGVLASALVSGLAGAGLVFGAVFGLLALTGDLLSSFLKRRFGLLPSARVPGLDQIPEALLPMGFAALWLGLGWGVLLTVTILFVIANMVLSPLMHRLGIRKQPH